MLPKPLPSRMLAIICSTMRTTEGGGVGALLKRLISAMGPPAFNISIQQCEDGQIKLFLACGMLYLSCWFPEQP